MVYYSHVAWRVFLYVCVYVYPLPITRIAIDLVRVAGAMISPQPRTPLIRYTSNFDALVYGFFAGGKPSRMGSGWQHLASGESEQKTIPNENRRKKEHTTHKQHVRCHSVRTQWFSKFSPTNLPNIVVGWWYDLGVAGGGWFVPRQTFQRSRSFSVIVNTSNSCGRPGFSPS